MPDVRLACAPTGFEVRTAQGTLLGFFQPVAPREHVPCSSAFYPSSDDRLALTVLARRSARALMVRSVSPFSAAARRKVSALGSGAPPVTRAMSPRTDSHHLRPCSHGVPAQPSITRAQLAPSLGVNRALRNHSGAPGSRVLLASCPSSAQPAPFSRQPNPGVQRTRFARR
jgi:hypothetical protein